MHERGGCLLNATLTEMDVNECRDFVFSLGARCLYSSIIFSYLMHERGGCLFNATLMEMDENECRDFLFCSHRPGRE